MSEKKMLLLGLLLSHEMHGYQLNEYLQQNPAIAIRLKKSNAYKLLNDMEDDGWVTHVDEQEGNRPQRRVYSVTEKGTQNFYKLLRNNLSSYPMPEFPGVVGFDFVYMLPAEEAASLLAERLEAVEEKFQELDDLSDEIRESHFSVGYLHHYYGEEIKWLKGMIAHLLSGERGGL